MKKEHLLKQLLIVALAAVPLGALGLKLLPEAEREGRIRSDKTLETKKIFGSELIKKTGETPKRIGPTGSTIYGYMSYCDVPDFTGGFYEVTPQGKNTRLWEYYYAQIGATISNGWLYNGHLCGLGAYTLGSEDLVGDYAYQEFDLETGEILVSRSIDISEDRLPYFVTAAYNPTDNRIYGFGRTGDPMGELKYVFKSAPAQRPEDAKVVKNLDYAGDRCYSFCYSVAENCFYGVNTQGILYRWYTDGTSEEVMDVSVPDLANLQGALTVSPRDGYLLWCPALYVSRSDLYAVYPSEKRMEKIYTYPQDSQFNFFFTVDDVTSQNVPAAPVIEKVSFKGASLEGAVSFTMPGSMLDGESLTGNLDWKLLDNGEELKSGEAEPRETIEIPITVSQGEHVFSVIAVANGKTGYPAVTKTYVGYDNPCAPTEVHIAGNEVLWEPVTTGQHGGYLDASAVKYTVFLNDDRIGDTTGTSMTIELDEEKEQDIYIATVIAASNGMESLPGRSQGVVLGKPYPLPMTILPTEHDTKMVVTINNDGSPEYGEWRVVDFGGYLVWASGWSYLTADDWLIMPAAAFPDSQHLYEVTLNAGRSNWAREYFEVWAGDAPTVEAMTIPVIAKTRPARFDEEKPWNDYSGVFAVPSPGTYYIGIRCISEPDQKDLYVRNIRVNATDILTKVPAAVDDLEVISTSDKDLTATVSFRMPTKFVNGEEIAGTVKAEISGADTVEAEGGPGSLVEVTVPTKQGDNVIVVTTFFDGKEGQKAQTDVFTGMDMLGFCENLSGSTSEDNMSVTLTWKPPTESLNGGYFADKNINYWVGAIDSFGEFLEEPRFAGTDVTTYTYTVPEHARQNYARIGLAAENAAGISYARTFISVNLGVPYRLPIIETFENMTVEYTPLMVSTPNESYQATQFTWGQPELVDPSFERDSYDPNDPEIGMVAYTESAPSNFRLALPKVSTIGAKEPNITFDIWTGQGGPSKLKVYVTTWGQKTPTKIADIPAGTGWELANVVLPDSYKEKQWITLYIDGTLPTTDNYFLLMGYAIDPESGIHTISSHDKGFVIARKGYVELCGLGGITYLIYSIDGKLLRTGSIVSEIETVDLPTGFYVIKAGDKSFRVAVR